ncbi:hypothetical protein CDAR_527401 [Caerostris darwini]|uniref:Uncharacterized protein n=1 Tax=Caerostris darwini TaxID=1538125 RepID=A0AAV4WJH5_9ARAC|nr:hypothetical protein CDAR_527401 [Caerostris darwini]
MHSKWGSRVCSSLPEDEEGVLTFPGLHPPPGKGQKRRTAGGKQESGRFRDLLHQNFTLSQKYRRAEMYNDVVLCHVGLKEILRTYGRWRVNEF